MHHLDDFIPRLDMNTLRRKDDFDCAPWTTPLVTCRTFDAPPEIGSLSVDRSYTREWCFRGGRCMLGMIT